MKRSRVIILASAGALVSTAVVGAATFFGNTNAAPLPEGAVWQNFLLPEPQINKHYGLAGLRDHMNLQLPHYGDPYTGISMSSRLGSGNIEDGSASSNPEVDEDNLQNPTRNRQLVAANFNRSFDNGGGGSDGGSRGGFHPTFPGLLSAMDGLRSELEDSIEPPFGPRNEKDPIDDLVSNDDPMSLNPDPNDDIPPVDDQPLPEQEVPEPQSWALLLAGLFGLRLLRRRTS